jgi:GAF domain-containing protein
MSTLLEKERVQTLKRYEILDTPADGTFDRLAALASKIFNVPIAIISLVDHDRIWFKSHEGLDINEIDRTPGLCSSAILSDELYIVEDARKDPRTLANPLVAGEFGLQFYAAAPLKTKNGFNLGTFCLIDKKKRYLNTQQQQMLEDLAAIVMDEIELRLAARMKFEQLSRKVNKLKEKQKDLQ